MPPDAAVLHVVRAYNAATLATRTTTVAYAAQSWQALGSWRDADVDDWIGRIVPVVKGGQRRVASLTDAYLAHIELAATGRRVPPVGVPDELLADLRGVPVDEVYRRPAVQTWTALSKGVPIAAAVALGLDRVNSLVSTDMQLAKTHAARYVFSKRPGVTRFRRVLNSGNPCDLCESAAEDVYSHADLLPIHPGCDCGVEPIYGADDPGAVDAIASNDLPDLAVHEHGEIGPVLTVAGQTFTGPDDI